MGRAEVLQSLFEPSGKGLEIGPSHNPLMPKAAGFDVEILDYLDAEGLRRKYAEAGCDVSRVEEVDYIGDGRPMTQVIGDHHRYNWIVASHVIEHVPDLLGFLLDCETLLKPGGSLVLAVPDKRCCFDILRPVSTIGQVLQAHVDGRKKPPPGVIFDDLAYARKRNGQIGWSLNSREPLQHVRTVDEAARFFELSQLSSEYLDVHCWVFVPSSFRLILSALRAMEKTQFSEKRFLDAGGEFYSVLSAGLLENPVDLGTMVLAAQAEEQAAFEFAELAARLHLAEAESKLAQVQRELTTAETRYAALLESEAASRKLVVSLTDSLSWKITAPLRAIKRMTRARSNRAGHL